MAVGEIIGAAIGILMLIIVAYLVVGNTLSTADMVTNTQKDISLKDEVRLRTGFSIQTAVLNRQYQNVTLSVYNNGNEVIYDYPHMDLFFYNKSNPSPAIRQYGSGAGKWSLLHDPDPLKDVIHPGQCDPGEIMWISASYDPSSATDQPETIQVATANGVYGFSNVVW